MYNLAHRLLSKFEPELSHNLSIRALKLGIYPKLIDKSEDTLLEQSIWGRRFKNPIGLSAGYDKNAEVIEPILNLGFGFTEVGTVTPRSQLGNPKPRIFRLREHQAIANSLGFNNLGMDVFEKNINQFNTQSSLTNKIVGINIGNNKDSINILDDLKILFDRLHRLSDYIVVNLSSPNTPGLRDNLKSENFNRIVTSLIKFREDNHSKVPILFKISPDISDQDKKDIALIALANDVDGLILTNTTVEKSFLDYEIKGGISGKPLFEKSNNLIRDFYTLTSGKVKIIGVGGIFNANDILLKMKLGASLVQLYTSLAYRGPYHIKNLISDLKNLIHQEGYRNISDLIGQSS